MTARHARIPCPFGPCNARPEVLPMRGLSLEVPAVDLIRQHDLDPDSWFGLCPASGQEYPASGRLTELLQVAEVTLLEMRAERALAAAQHEHGIAPARPPRERSGSPRWFRNSEQGDPRDRGPSARPKLTVVPVPDTQGRAMPSTADVKAAVDAANVQIAEGMELARQAQERMEIAKVKLMWVREMTVDTLGVPQVSAAVEQLETAQQLARIAIENNQTYTGNL